MGFMFLYSLAIFSIVVSIITWYLDLFKITEKCIYCRCERTVVGLLGVLMILPHMLYATHILSYALGFFGATVTANQIFMIIQKKHFNHELILSICTLVFVVFQVWVIHFFK